MLGFAVTIFISAFLLFQVQPLIGKYILPWFGGGPAVWTSCMLFFQMLLLGGYAYAHVIRTRLSQRTQVIVHVTLLAATLLALPIAPSEGWKPQGDENPALYILLLLAVTVGLPYFVLSATGPLLQAWFSVRHPGRSPYRLYALSNVGSLLALLSYPFLVEPAMALRSQSTTWSIGFGLFVAFCIVSALSMLRVRPTDADEAGADEDSAPPGWGVCLVWVALAACGSTMLLAVTNQMSWDVAVVPFLWVLPLTLYLLTFIICFEFERWYYRPVFWPLLGLGAGAIVHLMFEGVRMPILFQVAGYAGGMFFCCMVCHGELVRLKPSPRYLTSFYLMVSAGGALGGLFVSLVAPAVFPMYLELHIGLWMTCALALVVYLYSRGLLSFWRWPVKEIARGGAWAVGASAVVVYTVLLVYAVWEHGNCGAMEPYLSLMPLILYTAVFALQLGRERWYVHPVVQVIVVAGAGGMLWYMADVGKPGIAFQAAAHAAGMLAWYGVFHRELTSLAPDRADLRWFYLVVTVGAGIGGGLMALAAPAGLAQYLWVHIALWGACTATLAVYARTR
ncbi:hypothetical protein HQ560_05685, partial [bacterium]|nr:hypothetical protein [bacterium]